MLNIFKDQRGTTPIRLAIMFIAIYGFICLGLDLWQFFYRKQKMQKAVDFAALAGAQELINGNTGNAV